MLPLTPPNESFESTITFAEAIDRDNGVFLTGPEQHISNTTHISNSSMGLDNMDDRSDMDERSDSHDLSDEDQDMSDGGAELSGGILLPTPPHTTLPNTGIDLPDAEILDHDHPSLLQSSYYHSEMEDDTPFYYSEPFFGDEISPPSPPLSDLMLNDLVLGPADTTGLHTTGLPAVMSELSHQLQHIQDGQEHVEFTSDAQNGAPDNMEDQFNLSLGDFLYAWGRTMARDDEPRRRARGPFLPAVSRQRDIKQLDPMEECELKGESCDIQRINWQDLGITRVEARDMRRQTYKNYTNLRASHRPPRNGHIPMLLDQNDFFKFRRMDFDHDIHLSHFQLRNLVACTSRDHIFYAGRSQVMHYSPMEGRGISNRYPIAMDLTQPNVLPLHGAGGAVQISTLTVAHDILVAGGFCGEYGITNLRAQKDSKHSEGIITDDPNAITNHVQVHLSRGSSLPLAAFASNDKGVRILDVNTNKIIAGHKYEHAINCTAISPDQRLRVLTGDTRKVMICNAETGAILQELDGHRDYGFACDWADDGVTVATGNQDMQIQIWDARKWTNSRGMAQPTATIAAEMAGVRKLKFSPLGSGKRVLVAAEPADVVSIIDAGSFSTKQTLSFFGEIGGVDFTNNGNDLIIANCDSMRGGMMEFERCGLAGDAFYEYGEMRGWEGGRNKIEKGYDWLMDDESSTSQWNSRGTTTQRLRKPAALATSMTAF